MATEGIKRHVAKNGAVSWRVRVELSPDPVTGKRRGAMKTFRTRAEAETARRRWLTEVEQGIDVDPSKLTVGEYLIDWLRTTAKCRLRATSHRMYEYHLAKYVLPDLGGVPLQRLTAARLKAHIDGAKTPNIGKVSRRLLHIALGEAADLGLLAFSPVDRVKAPRAPKPRRAAWSAEEAARFLDVAADDPYQPLWTLAIYTGMRRGELLGLRWRDVDLEAGRLAIEQQIVALGARTAVQPPKTESGKRTIDLPPEVVEVLRAHRLCQLEHRRAVSEWHDHDLVCAARNGQPIGPRNLVRRFHTLRERAGLPDMPLHGTRHTAATIMLTTGTQMHEVSEILGHSTPTTTMAIYARVLRDRKKEATGRLADAIKRGSRKASEKAAQGTEAPS